MGIEDLEKSLQDKLTRREKQMKKPQTKKQANLAEQLKVKRPKEQTPQEKGATFDRYTKALKPVEGVGEFKVTNEPLTKKLTHRQLKNSLNSYKGHNTRQRLEIVKLRDEKKTLGSDIWALEVTLEDEKCFHADVQKSLTTAEGIISERDAEIEDIKEKSVSIVAHNIIQESRSEWRDYYNDECVDHSQTKFHKGLSIAFNIMLLVGIAATLVINYGGF